MDALPGSPFPIDAELPPILEFSGEFGAEANSFIPFVYWLHLSGLMRRRQIRTYQGMRPFYFFLRREQVLEKPERRRYVAPEARPAWLPTRNDHDSRRSPFEVFPDFRAHYHDGLFESDKPLLVVHNKFTVEWGRGPVNFLSPDMLHDLFAALGNKYQIVYLRPGMLGEPAGYSGDHQPDLRLNDLAVARSFPGVWLFDEIAAAFVSRFGFNELKLRLYSHGWCHITVQGGNAHLASLFSGGLVAVLHRAGQELRHSYAHGHFGYAAQPSPTYMICRNEDELARTVPVLRDCALIAGRIVPSPAHAEALQALSPEAQRSGSPAAGAVTVATASPALSRETVLAEAAD